MAGTTTKESYVVEIASEMDQIVEDKVTIEMNEMFQGYRDGGLQPKCCIYRVPIVLNEGKNKVYMPKFVSIGPFHYGDKRLQDMERYKHVLFKSFTQRAKVSLDDLVGCVKDLVPKVRESYFGTIDMTEQRLVELTLVDAAFIIEFFIMQTCSGMENGDVILSQPWLVNSIFLDLILLENQLPLFVIEELFNKAMPHDHRGSLPSFLSLACSVFEHNGKKLELIPELEIKHFTDLIRWFYLQGKMAIQHSQGKMAMQHSQGKMTIQHSSLKAAKHILRYNANALQEVGIQFKASKSKCLSDLKFSRYTLEIPQIDVDDFSETLFCNMMALEQWHYPHASYITEYASIMYWLIDTCKDVDILVHNKIVSNHLGDSNSVASLFNSLGENVFHTSFNAEYLDICRDLNHWASDPWRRVKPILKRQILRSITSFLLNNILTLIQTIIAIRHA